MGSACSSQVALVASKQQSPTATISSTLDFPQYRELRRSPSVNQTTSPTHAELELATKEFSVSSGVSPAVTRPTQDDPIVNFIAVPSNLYDGSIAGTVSSVSVTAVVAPVSRRAVMPQLRISYKSLSDGSSPSSGRLGDKSSSAHSKDTTDPLGMGLVSKEQIFLYSVRREKSQQSPEDAARTGRERDEYVGVQREQSVLLNGSYSLWTVDSRAGDRRASESLRHEPENSADGTPAQA